ncbi:MAG: hypothetical protein ABI707_12115 [Ferruginibacter sp.]
MRDLILFGLFIILLLAAQFASAKTADEVIEKYIKARGGKDKLASVKSIYMEGTKEITGMKATIKIIKKQDKLSRTEIENGIANEFVLITDKEAWTFFPLISPVAHKVPGDVLAGLQTEMDIAGPLADYIAKGHKAELLGKETVEGNACYKIKLITRAGKEMMFWVDAATYLVNQSSAITIGDGGGVASEILTSYRNYKEVEGIQFAHTCETKTIGPKASRMGEETLFYKILINPIIDPKMFFPEN